MNKDIWKTVSSGLPADASAALAGHYYTFLKRLDPEAGELVWRAGMLAVHFSQQGHSCLSLHDLAGQRAATLLDQEAAGLESEPLFPEVAILSQQLLASRLVGRPGAFTPLVLDEACRLYLFRYWQYEQRLAGQLRQRLSGSGFAPQDIRRHLRQLFPGPRDTATDWQQVAAAVAALKKISLISGGPGTGKTFTVVKIIALFQLLAKRKLAIGLAAPTGKAASRLQESIKGVGASLNLPRELQALEAMTIHRLLGPIRHSPFFRYRLEHRLPLDVLIVDEVSMVDLALMTKLIEAMPDDGHLVLLGDKDQLSSVEAGRVMADLCQGAEVNVFSQGFARLLAEAGAGSVGASAGPAAVSALADCQVYLTKSYRFTKQSAIGRLALAVLAGNVQQVQACCALTEEVKKYPAIDWSRPASDELQQELTDQIVQGYAPLFKETEPLPALAAFSRFQVLCAHRVGSSGVGALNKWIEARLAAAQLIAQPGEWYSGKPIMVTGNHYSLGLYNGDIGIVLADGRGGLRLYFIRADASLLSISPARAPSHEAAYALTVHKSQGSEFEHVLLMLPERESRIVGRELLYTAITRAKKSFTLWGSDAVLEGGVRRVTERGTGLAALLE